MSQLIQGEVSKPRLISVDRSPATGAKGITSPQTNCLNFSLSALHRSAQSLISYWRRYCLLHFSASHNRPTTTTYADAPVLAERETLECTPALMFHIQLCKKNYRVGCRARDCLGRELCRTWIDLNSWNIREGRVDGESGRTLGWRVKVTPD